jgi:hypothetical protein
VQFRLVQPVLSPLALADVARLRNQMAAAVFGLTERLLARRDPAGPPPQAGYGLLDTLRAAGTLTDCDVPLALIHWTASRGIEFVDMWSVRRGITARGADRRWPWLLGDRLTNEAEALFLQFQEHVDDIASSGESASAIVATDRFVYLPPMGILPLQIGTRLGFDPHAFFGPDVVSRDIAYLDADRLRPLLQESFLHDPIDLSSRTRVQLYLVFENIQAAAAGQPVTPILVFASHTLPYRGVARYGFARWEQSRFAHAVI